MQTLKYMRQGCHVSLVNFVNKESNTLQPQDIKVVRDFLDVFPEDLPGLLPDREVEFTIELVPGTTPILKAPYRIAPVELKELKEQLQDQLDKGFIKPSVSL